MVILLKAIYIQSNPYQNSKVISPKMEKPIFKFIKNCKGPKTVKIILKKKNKTEGLTFPLSTVIKSVILANGMINRSMKQQRIQYALASLDHPQPQQCMGRRSLSSALL